MYKTLVFLILTIFCQHSFCQYTPSEVATGINPNTGYNLKKDEEERFKRVFNGMEKPEKYKVPSFNNSEQATALSSQQSFENSDSGNNNYNSSTIISPQLKNNHTEVQDNTPHVGQPN